MSGLRSDPHKSGPVLQAGAAPEDARLAVVLIHGRGATAESMLPLAEAFDSTDVAYVAPQAVGHAWYPLSFLAPTERNEPYLSSALAQVGRIVDDLVRRGMAHERIVLIGFSQGACLATEFAARNARRYGGVAALSGGLIGETPSIAAYRGSFAGTPILLGCSTVDAHIPAERVRESTRILRDMGAKVDERLYPGMGHTVNDDEIAWIAALLAGMTGEAG